MNDDKNRAKARKKCDYKKCTNSPTHRITNARMYPKVTDTMSIYRCDEHRLWHKDFQINYPAFMDAYPKLIIVPSLWRLILLS